MMHTTHIKGYRFQRILVLGASGAGTTTLGRAVANALATSHFDLDDIFWLPSDPPYAMTRPIPERLVLIDQLFLSRQSYILSGSPLGWDITITPRLQAVVFLYTSAEIRLARLIQRETLRSLPSFRPQNLNSFPAENTQLNYSAVNLTDLPNFFNAGQKELIEWASKYDDPDFSHRSLSRHETWLSTLSCPILRLEGNHPIDQLLDTVLSFISRNTEKI